MLLTELASRVRKQCKNLPLLAEALTLRCLLIRAPNDARRRLDLGKAPSSRPRSDSPLISATEGFAVRLISLYLKFFNALLTAYADFADVDGLTEAFHDIPATYPSITPDLVSLFGALCGKGDFDAALGTVDLMERNRATYETKGSSEAEKIWALMQKKNIKPDSKSFNVKLRWLVTGGKTFEAAKLMNQMKRDTFSFNALLKCYFVVLFLLQLITE